ncbi:D-alanyl-D-alanine carboxypeptidase family protein [Pseudothioclava nitratireducens]|uniref:D-alanyl-D-alanine carboxypeptidase family protein n=1 Tax=Pseudothioclava nitratireducens TaxID=1928646 RepID=UPI0023DA47BC|nr:D-alanyl-D-alanine carboxypeptidase family protein [Defluviimonas nitratireducens]MDF1619575.1 D-alanyl-D-alanine carboxypeptidase [Defluviimonas nitratireducens]
MLHLRLIALLCLSLLAALPARAFETRASAAWVYDMTTQTVLLEKNADIPLPPASMSKLMTVNLLFEALKDGRVTMETTMPVSATAQAMGGSTMFLNTTDRPSVSDLLHGIIVNSGNDACVVVAEGLAGSESAFANLMTERARALGMNDSMFANASGWPHPGQRMSMHDLGVLAVRLISEFPEHYPIFAETTFNYKDRAPANANNRNPLLKLGAADWHADGLKTGHTEEAGYGLVGSAIMGERRIVFVISGLGSETERAQESEAIVNWAFRQFVLKDLAAKGTRLAEAPVWLGASESVGLVPQEDLRLLIPAAAQDQIKAEAVFTGPIAAPIAAGDQIAELVITIPGLDAPKTVPLVAESDVAAGGFMVRAKAAFARLTARAMQAAGV